MYYVLNGNVNLPRKTTPKSSSSPRLSHPKRAPSFMLPVRESTESDFPIGHPLFLLCVHGHITAEYRNIYNRDYHESKNSSQEA